MKVGVVRFLGTNCDHDVFEAVRLLGGTPEYLWFENQFDPKNYGALLIPGGFSYGDYLRCGALAAKAPAMISVIEAAKRGVPVLGICNGFQILCEAQLLPGALLRNIKGRFIDRWVKLSTINSSPHFPSDRNFSLPVAHGEGCYYAPDDEIQKLYDQNQVWLEYTEPVNGSVKSIAGIMNQTKNVLALMPHPERALASWMGSDAGTSFFAGLS